MANLDGNMKNQQHELTPRDDKRKTVSEVLKRVDNFIRRGELEQAEICVTEAREIDPKNIYAFAFQERITILKEQAHQNSLAAAACKAAEEAKCSEMATLQSKPFQSPIEQTKTEPRPQSVPQKIPPKQSAVAIRSVVEAKPIQQIASPTGKSPVSPPERSVIPKVSMKPLQSDRSQQVEAQCNSEEERNLKIQRMIKTAVEAARKEVELKQIEIRAKQREEFIRREQVNMREAAEAARKAEEQRQIELRRKADALLQQKIRELISRKLGPSSIQVTAVPMPTNEPDPNRISETQPPLLTLTDPQVSKERLETLERYRLVLSSIWADGAISEEEAVTLNQLREALSISTEEHARLEKEVQHDTYIEAFKKAWNSGTITPENASVLAELRERFKISNEEHLKIESRILWEIQPLKNRPTLLVIDDDERLLKVVSKTLNEAGFITTPVTTSDEAYAYLKESSPDLILCDVNLETSTMGGFAFYEKVREFERLRDTPFIFLSGLSDEALVRTGKELGADDYLSKPISEETLVATIKGKLRRYTDLKKRMN